MGCLLIAWTSQRVSPLSALNFPVLQGTRKVDFSSEETVAEGIAKSPEDFWSTKHWHIPV